MESEQRQTYAWPQCPHCFEGQYHSKKLVRESWVVGLPFAVVPRGLAVFPPNTVDEACCCFKCSVQYKSRRQLISSFAGHTILHGSDSQKVALRPAATVYLRTCSICKFSGLILDPLNQKLGAGSGSRLFNQPSRWLWCLIKFKKTPLEDIQSHTTIKI